MNRDNIVGFAYLDADAGAGVPVHAWTFEAVNAARMALEELVCYDLEFHDIRWFRCSEREAPQPMLMEQVEQDPDCWDTEDEDEDEEIADRFEDVTLEIEDALFVCVSCGVGTVEETVKELKSIAKTYFDVEINSIQFEELEELITDLHGADVPDEEMFEAADKIIKIMQPAPWPFPKA